MSEENKKPNPPSEPDFEPQETVMVSMGMGPENLKKETPYLLVLEGKRLGEIIKIPRTIRIGRSPNMDIHIPDEGISRFHLCIEIREDGVYAIDQGSRNGTFINGNAIKHEKLKDGDKIRIGTFTIMKFSFADSIESSFQDKIYSRAIKDGLTDVFNRRYFDEYIQIEFAFALRHQTPFSLIMIDLDNFKHINDHYGHPAGDKVLVQFAEICKQNSRKEDLIARYGGEEFVICCRATLKETAKILAERIRQRFSTTAIQFNDSTFNVTISAGIATFPAEGIDSIDQLIKTADTLLYKAKQLGKNRVLI